MSGPDRCSACGSGAMQTTASALCDACQPGACAERLHWEAMNGVPPVGQAGAAPTSPAVSHTIDVGKIHRVAWCERCAKLDSVRMDAQPTEHELEVMRRFETRRIDGGTEEDAEDYAQDGWTLLRSGRKGVELIRRKRVNNG